MSINLEALTLTELRDLQKQVVRQIETYEVRQKQKALEAVKEAAGQYGFSLKDLVGDDQKVKTIIAPKYADPENKTLTWSGRGRKPRWVQARLDEGRSLDDLAI